MSISQSGIESDGLLRVILSFLYYRKNHEEYVLAGRIGKEVNLDKPMVMKELRFIRDCYGYVEKNETSGWRLTKKGRERFDAENARLQADLSQK